MTRAFLPAEYALFEGGQLVARIIRMDDGWRACRPTATSKIGLAVSPIGLNSFKEVRQWTIEQYSRSAK